MNTTTDNTTFEERLQARLAQVGDRPTKQTTPEQREVRNKNARDRYAALTEAQKKAYTTRARDRYHDKSPEGSRVRRDRRADEANKRIEEMVHAANTPSTTKTKHTNADVESVNGEVDNVPPKIVYTPCTEEIKKKQRERYANRTEEQKEAQRAKDREYYHKIHPNARYLEDMSRERAEKKRCSEQWYIDACKELKHNQDGE